MRLIIDGDGCPVVEEVSRLGEKYGLPVIIVTSFAHYSQKYDKKGITYYFVDVDPQMADYKIASIIQKGDMLITQDYGLASIVIHKARVIHHMGFEFTNDNIDFYLNQRHIHAMNRRKYKRYTKIPQYSPENHQEFFIFLDQILAKA